MMEALALSPRGRPLPSNTVGSCSPLNRRQHKPRSTYTNVQWRFLPPTRQPTLSTYNQNENRILLPDAMEHPQARADLELEFQRRRRERDGMELEHQRVLYDLMGETQRRAMLDQVMGQMEAMATSTRREIPANSSPSRSPRRREGGSTWGVPQKSSVMHQVLQHRRSVEKEKRKHGYHKNWNPHAGSSPQDLSSIRDEGNENSGDESSDDELPEIKMIRERQRQIYATITGESNRGHHHLHVEWQESSKVKMATNIPASIRTALEGKVVGEDKEQMRQIVDHPTEGSSTARDQGILPLQPNISVSSSKKTGSGKTKRVQLEPPPEVDIATLLSDVESSRARRVQQARYGIWYIPQDEWWSLHQADQHSLSGSSQFQGSSSSSSEQLPLPHTLTKREIELQTEIPVSYIGREYRKYVVAKGARLPSFLH